MRYLGNKDTLLPHILKLLQNKGLFEKRLVFFDAFCGTGAVSNAIKQNFDIVINDNLQSALTFAVAKIMQDVRITGFKKLGFDPISFFNENKDTKEGFFYNNYAPLVSGRMYFSNSNAKRIDYFRWQIQEWKKKDLINETEYKYLLGCLLESTSRVANVAGVYGAYLKTWDKRATKDIVFLPIQDEIAKDTNNLFDSSCNAVNIIKTYNNNIKDIICDVDCDVLYLDPPYTKNKYSVQYHILETLVKNDCPVIKGVTGARQENKETKSCDVWSRPYYVEVELEKIIKNTKAQHIIISYSSCGLMSKDYIINVLKRYGIQESLDFVQIPYKKYKNHKTSLEDTKQNYEYLFYIKKKPKEDVIYCCPLNYMGGKSNIIKEIKPYLVPPCYCQNKATFFDLMGGGFNVGINARGFSHYIYNDNNFILKDILQMLKDTDTALVLKKIDTIIKKYGLQKAQKQQYLAYRTEYNAKLRYTKEKSIYLFVLILYGFQQQIRFNSGYEFNNPVGESGYNECIKEKIVSFCARLKEIDVIFLSKDFSCTQEYITKDTSVYIDPPYLITLASYNDGKRGFSGWSEKAETRLLDFLDKIKAKAKKLVISNIIEYKGKKNTYLIKWLNENKATKKDIFTKGRQEVLLIYEANIQNK